MRCADYYGPTEMDKELDKVDVELTELEEIRAAITGLGYEITEGMQKSYRQGFIDGYELAAKSLED